MGEYKGGCHCCSRAVELERAGFLLLHKRERKKEGETSEEQ